MNVPRGLWICIAPAAVLILVLATHDPNPSVVRVDVAPAHAVVPPPAGALGSGPGAAASAPASAASTAPTPLSVIQRAAKSYFPDMYNDAKYGLPDRFLPGTNPCWDWEWPGSGKGSHCLPSFLILGVYQSGVRDLYTRLSRHPGVAHRPANSPSYYSQVKPDWPGYVRELDSSVEEAKAGKLLGEASAVTFHFVWVHQEKFNQPYVEAMGRFWRACNSRSQAEKDAVPHRECMAVRMADGREADAEKARQAGMPMSPDSGVARERTFSVPQLVRAAYGEASPNLVVLLRQPWQRMHSAFYNYPHYRGRYGATAAGEEKWARESVAAFRRCEGNFSTASCALSFESLTRDNEETFYHCDQLIKGMYAVFLPRWRREFPGRVLPLRAEQYYKQPQTVLTKAMKFIGVAPPSDDAGWRPILSPGISVAGTRPAGGAPPLAGPTRELLKKFYTPSLRELVMMLQTEPDAAEWAAWSGV